MARSTLSYIAKIDNVDDVMAAHVNILQTNQEMIWNTLAFVEATELTISAGGVITVTSNYHTVDTNGDAASDNLDTITISGDIGEGSILILRPDHTDRTVVVRHDQGNILCNGNADITLDDSHDFAFLIYDETLVKWIAFGGGGAYASIAETSAGTEAAKAVTPDGLAGSDYGKRSVVLQPIADDLEHVVGDGKQHFPTPEWMAGWNLVDVRTNMVTAGAVGGLFSVMIHNLTQAQDMLSTVCSIDATEITSDTAAAPVVIDGAQDDITIGDVLRIDFDAVNTTEGKGAYIELVFSMP